MIIYLKNPINLSSIDWKRKKRTKEHSLSYLENLFFIDTKNKNKYIRIDEKTGIRKTNTINDILDNKKFILPTEQKFFITENNVIGSKTNEILQYIENNKCEININWRKISEEFTDFHYLTYALYKNLDKKYLTLLYSDEIIMLGYLLFSVRLYGLSEEIPYPAKILKINWKSTGECNYAAPSQTYFANKFNVGIYTTQISFSDMEQMGLFTSRKLPTGITIKKQYELVHRPKIYWLQFPLFQCLIKTYYEYFSDAFIINKIENLEEYYKKLEDLKEKAEERKEEQKKYGLNLQVKGRKYDVYMSYSDDKFKSIKTTKDFKTKLPYPEQKILIDQFKEDVSFGEKVPEYDQNILALKINKNPTNTPEQIKQKLYILDEYKRGNVKGLSVYRNKKTAINKLPLSAKNLRKNNEGYFFTIDNILPFIIKNKKLPFSCENKIPNKLKEKYQIHLLTILNEACINIFDRRNYPLIRIAMQYFYACYENYIPPKDEYKLKNWVNREHHVLSEIVKHCFGKWIFSAFKLLTNSYQKMTDLEYNNLIDSNSYDQKDTVELLIFLENAFSHEKLKILNENNSMNLDSYVQNVLDEFINKLCKEKNRNFSTKNYKNIYIVSYRDIEIYTLYKLIFVYIVNNYLYCDYKLINKQKVYLLENNMYLPLLLLFFVRKIIREREILNEKNYSIHVFQSHEFIFQQRNKIFSPASQKASRESIKRSRIDSKQKSIKTLSLKRVKSAMIGSRASLDVRLPLYREEDFASRVSLLSSLVAPQEGKGEPPQTPPNTIIENLDWKNVRACGKFHLPGKLFDTISPKNENFSVKQFSGFKKSSTIPEYYGRSSFLIFSDFIHTYLKEFYNISSDTLYIQYARYDPEFKIFLNKIKYLHEIKHNFIYPKIGIMYNYSLLQKLYYDFIHAKKEKIIYRYEDHYHEAKIKIYLQLQRMLKLSEYTPDYILFDLLEYLETIITPERIQIEKQNNTYINFLLKLEFSGIFHIHPDKINMFPYQEDFERYMFSIDFLDKIVYDC